CPRLLLRSPHQDPRPRQIGARAERATPGYAVHLPPGRSPVGQLDLDLVPRLDAALVRVLEQEQPLSRESVNPPNGGAQLIVHVASSLMVDPTRARRGQSSARRRGTKVT